MTDRSVTEIRMGPRSGLARKSKTDPRSVMGIRSGPRSGLLWKSKTDPRSVTEIRSGLVSVQIRARTHGQVFYMYIHNRPGSVLDFRKSREVANEFIKKSGNKSNQMKNFDLN